jgi:ribonuclease HI
VGSVDVRAGGGGDVSAQVFVVDFRPLGFDCILGMNAISALGGVTIIDPKTVIFRACNEEACATGLYDKREDFTVSFDEVSKQWTVSWNWCDGREPEGLANQVAEYSIPQHVRDPYEAELQKWIGEGWLREYDERKLGPPRGLIPLLAVVQENKGKVRPVLDYRELNSHVEAFTADADVCADKLREWRRKGVATAILDLQTAYMQIKVHESLWPFQTVVFRGRRYCLTRLGFGLNIAPQVMKTVIAKALERNEKVLSAASPYVDDIYVDESVLPASAVKEHLLNYGLTCKPVQTVADGARVLGLSVWGDSKSLLWKRSNEVPAIPDVMTRRTIFSLCGKLTSHLPVCNWLRPAVGFIKRRVNSLSVSWDDEVKDSRLRSMIDDMMRRVVSSDPARGRWDVSGTEAEVWVDASSLAVGAAVSVNGSVVEDASWLRPDDGSHINMAELDAVIKGINMALAWKMKKLHLRTDSQTVFHWVSDALSGKSRLKTKATGEMLIRRRIGIITSLTKEYHLDVNVTLVPSAHNIADALTRVPRNWLKQDDGDQCGVEPTCAAVHGQEDLENTRHKITRIHENTGHQGVDRSLYFARRANLSVDKDDVRAVIEECSQCLSLDPAPVRWTKGSLSVDGIWERIGMDITHYSGSHFLTLIDHGPSRFSMWRRLASQDTSSVIRELEAIFYERGAPIELVVDNDTAFRSERFKMFARKWAISIHFRCAYVPSGNGIA